ncbi:thioredoxin domain-containing protein [Haloactinopolyspora sp.]|uniref:DsbA family protein n=1 Tax=Haloactinopolyspora sp. TaxID=1966353 RepID=UPI00260FF66B|nr:thioredoxin domain-containing protein [Haloactinopolyspora sp.]
MSAKKASARQRAEAERLEQARRARQRERMLRFGISGVVLLVVVVVAIVLLRPDRPEGTGAVPEAATADGTGVAVGDASAPVTIDYWLDFQCPACGEFEAENGGVLTEIAADGTAQVIYHPAAFLGEESERAANAFGCAADAGRPAEYKAELFAHQPEEGAGGYTVDELVAHGEAAGITSAQFESCVREGTYSDWGATVLDAMREHDIESTPTVMLNGEPLEDPAGMSAEEFRAAVDNAVTSS